MIQNWTKKITTKNEDEKKKYKKIYYQRLCICRHKCHYFKNYLWHIIKGSKFLLHVVMKRKGVWSPWVHKLTSSVLGHCVNYQNNIWVGDLYSVKWPMHSTTYVPPNHSGVLRIRRTWYFVLAMWESRDLSLGGGRGGAHSGCQSTCPYSLKVFICERR